LTEVKRQGRARPGEALAGRDNGDMGYPASQMDMQRCVLRYILAQVPCQALPAAAVVLPRRKTGRFQAVDHPFRYVPEHF
jgi:hypothetical protein